jgi:hypothetical protein
MIVVTSMFLVAFTLALGVLFIPNGTLIPGNYGTTKGSMDGRL